MLLVLLLVALPLAELYVVVQVAHAIGVLDTLGLLVLVSVVGAWLVRREGIGVLRRVQAQTLNGTVPTAGLVDGAILLAAGGLLLVPGFITAAVGLLLLLPPVRVLVRKVLTARFRRRTRPGFSRRGGRGRGWSRVVVDADGHVQPQQPSAPPRELEP